MRRATTTSIASSVSPAVTGQPVTYTATVATVSAGGTVAFSDGGTPISSCAAQRVGLGGVAQCTITYTARGSHTIQATYSGYGRYAPSSSTTLAQPVLTATTLSLSASANPAPVGQQVLLTTKVSPSPSGGTVSFVAGSPIPGCTAVPVQSSTGIAYCRTTFTATGRRSIRATYSGNALFAGSDAPLLLFSVQ